MAVRYALPKPTEPLLDQFGKLSAPWYNYLRTRYGDDAAEEIIASIEAQIADLLVRVEALEEGESARIVGPQSVSVVGSLQNGLVQLTLVNDEALPLPVSFYATDENQEKGWRLLQPDWVPNPYADYLVDENGDYLIDENGNFLNAQDGFPIPLEYGGTGGDYHSVAQNLIWASPDGLAGAPVFRALVTADLPTPYLPLSGGTMTGNVVVGVDDFRIAANTSLGSDTRRIAILSGGAFSATRGAYVAVHGLNHATAPGQAQIIAANGFPCVLSGTATRPLQDNNATCGALLQRWSDVYGVRIRPGTGAVIWTSGTGTPEGVVVAPVGSLFTRTDGGAGTTLYCKESGAGNTGWVAK